MTDVWERELCLRQRGLKVLEIPIICNEKNSLSLKLNILIYSE